MVNVKNLFGMAVMATALVGCSSNDDLSANGNGNGESNVGANYASFNIELPSTRGTRAAGDPTYEAGDAKEYAVNNAQLVVFQKVNEGDTEDKYKFVETVDLGNLEPWKKDEGSGVTRFANITAKLSNVTVKSTDKYYALIVLNNDDKVKLPTKGATYSSWNVASNAEAASKFLNNTNGFYMANAPKYESTTAEPTTLVPIKGIYSTKQEAQSKPATTVYVERGMAKVTIESTSFGADKDVTSTGSYSNDKYEIQNWTLDVLNKSTFPVHMTNGLMAGGSLVPAMIASTTTPGTLEAGTQSVTGYSSIWNGRFVGTGEFERVYWGIDPNYSLDIASVEASKIHFNLAKATGDKYSDGSDISWKDGTAPLYCLENTFDIKHMMQGQTTRVIFKAVYTPNGITTGDNFYKIGNNNTNWSEENLKKQIIAKAQEVLNETDASTINVVLNLPANNINGEGGTKWLVEGNVQHNSANVSAADIDKINNKLGLNKVKGVGIATYKSGVCYYIARIKHFNELTSWGAGQPTYGDINDTNNYSYLGRYGVLRNNWYELKVNSVSGPGYPDVPEVKPTDPDDEDTKFINVEVKILDWAKRSQSVDL